VCVCQGRPGSRVLGGGGGKGSIFPTNFSDINNGGGGGESHTDPPIRPNSKQNPPIRQWSCLNLDPLKVLP
jgi:hypothetical protein